MNYWYWWIMAAAFLVLELTIPAEYFLWLGVAAGINGVLLFLFPTLNWQIQFLIFSLITVALLILSKQFLNKRNKETTSGLGQRGEQYIGRTFVLIEAIENGHGKIQIDDTRWLVHGPTLPAGTLVRIVKSDDTIFKVVMVQNDEAT